MQIRYLAILDLNGVVVVEHMPNRPLLKAGSSSAVAAAALIDEKQPGFKNPLTKQLLERAQQSAPAGLLSFKTHNQAQEYYLSFNKQRVYVVVIDTPEERLSLDQARSLFHAMEKVPTTADLAAIAKNPPRAQVAAISAGVEQVKEVMLDSIEKALDRGEKIETLVYKAQRIGTESAPKFNSRAKGLANNQCCKVCCCDICCCDFSSCFSWFKRNCCCCGPCCCKDKAPQKTNYGSVADVDISNPHSGPSRQTMG